MLPNRLALILCWAAPLTGAVSATAEPPNEDDAWFDELMGLGEDPLFDEPVEAEAAEREELEAALAALRELSAWQYDASVSLGAGWKANALLEESNPVDSSYGEVALDVFGFKPAFGSGWELLGLGYLEYRRFEDVPGLSAESLALVQASAKRGLGGGWKAGAFFEGARSVQAYDASLVDFVTSATTVTFWQPELGLSVEKAWEGVGDFSLSPSYSWGNYDQEGERFEGANVTARFERELGSGQELSLEVGYFEEGYDGRLERLSRGSLGERILLQMEGWNGRLEWSLEREAGWFRRARTRATFDAEDDRVGDYYERGSWELRQDFDLVWGKWELDLAGAYGDLAYESRLVSLVGEETRRDASWRMELEARRGIGDGWEAFLRMEWSEKESNADRLSYESGFASLGVSFTGLLGH